MVADAAALRSFMRPKFWKRRRASRTPRPGGWERCAKRDGAELEGFGGVAGSVRVRVTVARWAGAGS